MSAPDPHVREGATTRCPCPWCRLTTTLPDTVEPGAVVSCHRCSRPLAVLQVERPVFVRVTRVGP